MHQRSHGLNWPSYPIERFEAFCRNENFSRRFVHRPLSLRILWDGSADMGGQSLGLSAGEFVTGLLPNLYTGPVEGSHPVLAVYVNLPGVWEGYQEVGRLYSDQVLYTIGNSWLDNFSHPSLKEGALYRLNRNSMAHSSMLCHQFTGPVPGDFPRAGRTLGDDPCDDGEPIAHLLWRYLRVPNRPSRAPQRFLRVGPAHCDFGSGFLQSVSVIPNSPQIDLLFAGAGVLLQRAFQFYAGYNVLGVHGERHKRRKQGRNVSGSETTVSLVAHIDGVRWRSRGRGWRRACHRRRCCD